MVQQASTNFIDSFSAEVHRAYQSAGKLRKTVRTDTGVVGKTHQFPKSGKGVATRHNTGADVVAMNAGRSNVVVTLYPWDAFDYVDKIDTSYYNYDDNPIVVDNTIKAMERREDQEIIDALETGVVAGMEVDHATLAFTVLTLTTACELLDKNNVEAEDRYLAWASSQKRQLLNSTVATSSDYNTVKALVRGEIDSFVGFQFCLIGVREEGGLPLATNVQSAFYYHKQSVGLAISAEIDPSVDWVAQKRSWFEGCVRKVKRHASNSN